MKILEEIDYLVKDNPNLTIGLKDCNKRIFTIENLIGLVEYDGVLMTKEKFHHAYYIIILLRMLGYQDVNIKDWFMSTSYLYNQTPLYMLRVGNGLQLIYDLFGVITGNAVM